MAYVTVPENKETRISNIFHANITSSLPNYTKCTLKKVHFLWMLIFFKYLYNHAKSAL